MSTSDFDRVRPCMRRYVLSDDGFLPNMRENETLDFQLKGVQLSFSKDRKLGSGTLFITSRRVIWIREERLTEQETFEDQVAVDIDVPFIVLHAITRDPDSYPVPCVYCQLDSDDFDGQQGDDDEDMILDDEIFLAPAADEDLTKIFNALSHAALINPDPPEDGEQDGDDEFIYDYDEVSLGAEQARTLDHLESVFMEPTRLQRSAEELEEVREGDEMVGSSAQFEDADDC